MVVVEILNGLSGTSIIIVGSIFILAYFSTNTPNMLIRHVSRLGVLLLLLAASAVVYHAENGDIMKGVEVWTMSIVLVILLILSTWIISWLISFINKEGNLKNEEDL